MTNPGFQSPKLVQLWGCPWWDSAKISYAYKGYWEKIRNLYRLQGPSFKVFRGPWASEGPRAYASLHEFLHFISKTFLDYITQAYNTGLSSLHLHGVAFGIRGQRFDERFFALTMIDIQPANDMRRLYPPTNLRVQGNMEGSLFVECELQRPKFSLAVIDHSW